VQPCGRVSPLPYRESLLPLNTAIFDRLQVREQVAAMGVLKPGTEFVSDTTGQQVHFAFAPPDGRAQVTALALTGRHASLRSHVVTDRNRSFSFRS
jgi:hypothetical protein